MKRIGLIAACILSILLLASACAAPAPVNQAPSMGISPQAPAPAPAPAPSLPDRSAGSVTSTTEERRIVRTGSMYLVVKDVLTTRDRIAQIAQEMGGYVLSSSASGEEATLRASISVRVPDDKFEPALSQLRALAVRVRTESTSSQDVTAEYIDLQARLKNAQATETQYLNLLEKATTVEETLKIYDALSRVRSEIEQLKGRIQYIEQTTSTSLINVNLEPEVTLKPLAPSGWNASSIFNSAIRGLVTFGQWLGTVAIWLVIFIPVWGIIGGLIYWRVRAGKKRKAS